MDFTPDGAASYCVTGDGGASEGAPAAVGGDGMVDGDAVRVWACGVVAFGGEGGAELDRWR